MIGIIGIGNMGKTLSQPLLKNWIKKNQQIAVYNRTSTAYQFFKKNRQVKICKNLAEIFQCCDFIFLCIKPKDAAVFFEENRPHLKNHHKIISILAGVSLDQLTKLMNPPHLKSQSKSNPKLIRMMPNLPSQIGMGSGGFCFGKKISPTEKKQVAQMFSVFGNYIEIQEKLFDAMTSISGCGPAFVFLFIEALTSAGEKLGLSRKDALTLATSTVSGAAQLVSSSQEHPLTLVRQVTSPGGMTIEGVNWLEKKKLHDTVGKAVELAFKKSKKMLKKK